MLLSAVASRMSLSWVEHFQRNASLLDIPWHDACFLTREERCAVAASIQQFQLGEGARGRGFLRCGEAHARQTSDPHYVEALRLFIAEEQRHSAMLARFLNREGIPLLASHWVDSSFRKFRKLAGLEVCAAVLVTAELIALPYYRALHESTASPVLRAICRRILADEARHLQFQACTLARVRIGRGSAMRSLTSLAHLGFLAGTAAVVWFEHRRVFRCGGYSFIKFFRECVQHFRKLEASIERQQSILRGYEPLRDQPEPSRAATWQKGNGDSSEYPRETRV
jgi:hypothetical protein